MTDLNSIYQALMREAAETKLLHLDERWRCLHEEVWMDDHGKPEGQYLGTELKTIFSMFTGFELVSRLTYYRFFPGGRYFYGDPQSDGLWVHTEADYEAATARGSYNAGHYFIEANRIRFQSPGGTVELPFQALDDGIEIDGTTYKHTADQHAK